jgi:hypothetical protein
MLPDQKRYEYQVMPDVSRRNAREISRSAAWSAPPLGWSTRVKSAAIGCDPDQKGCIVIGMVNLP